MSAQHGKALTLQERRIIEDGIRNGVTKSVIAQSIGKNNSTIGREIKLHRTLTHKCSLPRECSQYQKCPRKKECTDDCPDFQIFKCGRRDRSPGACNGCEYYRNCRYNKYIYDAKEADKAYRRTLVESREGANLTPEEVREMAMIIAPMLKKGLSPFKIVQSHPELGICEKTLYNYIEGGVFAKEGINSSNLPGKTFGKLPKKKISAYKKRRADQA